MNEKTPSEWKAAYKDYSATTAEAVKEETPLAETTEKMEIVSAPATEAMNGEGEKSKAKKRKRKDADAEERPAESEEKKKKKKKKSKSEEQ